MTNGGKTIKAVDCVSVDKLVKILGTFDENLSFIIKETDTVCYVEGTKIRIEGAMRNVDIAEKALRAMVTLASTEEEIVEKTVHKQDDLFTVAITYVIEQRYNL